MAKKKPTPETESVLRARIAVLEGEMDQQRRKADADMDTLSRNNLLMCAALSNANAEVGNQRAVLRATMDHVHARTQRYQMVEARRSHIDPVFGVLWRMAVAHDASATGAPQAEPRLWFRQIATRIGTETTIKRIADVCYEHGWTLTPALDSYDAIHRDNTPIVLGLVPKDQMNAVGPR